MAGNQREDLQALRPQRLETADVAGKSPVPLNSCPGAQNCEMRIPVTNRQVALE